MVAIYGIPPLLKYSGNPCSGSNPVMERNSPKDSGSILISTYLPVKSVAKSPESIYALEPVIYRSTFGFTYKLSTTFSKEETFWISSRKI